MIDVHPAHHAASTWRDFFIHIAGCPIRDGLIVMGGVSRVPQSPRNHLLKSDCTTFGATASPPPSPLIPGL
jgi:hypothetical protein